MWAFPMALPEFFPIFGNKYRKLRRILLFDSCIPTKNGKLFSFSVLTLIKIHSTKLLPFLSRTNSQIHTLKTHWNPSKTRCKLFLQRTPIKACNEKYAKMCECWRCCCFCIHLGVFSLWCKQHAKRRSGRFLCGPTFLTSRVDSKSLRVCVCVK